MESRPPKSRKSSRSYPDKKQISSAASRPGSPNSRVGKNPRRNQRQFISALFFLTLCMVGIVAIFGLVRLFSGKDKKLTLPEDSNGEVIVATPIPTPSADRLPYQNYILFPETINMDLTLGEPVAEVLPSKLGLVENVYEKENPEQILDFQRETPINFSSPLQYQNIPGILTFRGGPFRNYAAWGSVEAPPEKLEQVWEFSGVESLKSIAWDFTWRGTGWTGQPIVVKWDSHLISQMNIFPDKKTKTNLIEVIVAAMDGKVYFLDLETGEPTRTPLEIGATIKGTPAVDPRGYPLLYVGQGDENHPEKEFGFRIYSLIDYTQLYFQTGLDERAYRQGWGGSDSSPLIDKNSDHLLYPVENGIFYTLKLNSFFDSNTGQVSVNPQSTDYIYTFNNTINNLQGIESSVSVYKNFSYFCDNSGKLICLDLNTLKMVWVKQLGDDSDVSPVLEEENNKLYLYVGTEVDWQRANAEEIYQGAAYTYKIDALTGDVVWETSQPCYTKSPTDRGDAINGGVLGNPIVGKQNLEHLVVFSYSMVNSVLSGNLVVAYDKITGEEAWRYKMNMYSWSSPVDFYDNQGNGYIAICDSVGQIHLVNGLTGERIDYLQTIRLQGTANETKNGINIESSPIVFDDMIVVGTRAGSILGIKIK